LLVETCIQSQADTNQRDPIQVSAHFLRTTFIAPYEIHVRTLKRVRDFTHITAELVQRVRFLSFMRQRHCSSSYSQGSTNITTHLIFGINVDTSSDSPHLNLLPPSPHARRTPLTHQQPSSRCAICNRTKASTVGGRGGLEWAPWPGFVDTGDLITSTSLAFLADMFSSLLTLLPPSGHKGLGTRYANPERTCTYASEHHQ